VSGKRILIVDEDHSARRSTVETLARAGFDCIEVADAEKALVAARGGDLSAVVIDLALSGVSGAECAWRLAQMEPIVPVVAVAEHTRMWQHVDVPGLGISSILSKPPTAEALVSAVLEAIAGARGGSSARGAGHG
jgi:two-component system response regulator FlrC